MKTNLWSSAASNGFLLSLITIVFVLFQAAFPLDKVAVTILLWVVKLVATVGVLYYFMKGFGQMVESYAYGAAFTYGFVVSLCSNIVIACYFYFHYTFIFPEAIDKAAEGMQMAFTQYQVDQTKIDLIMNNLPVISSIMPLIIYTILGLIFSSILASFAKKAEVVFDVDPEA